MCCSSFFTGLRHRFCKQQTTTRRGSSASSHLSLAGGGVDIISRLLAEKMSRDFHQDVILLNRPGATGNIGTEIVAKSDPDGYTLLMGNEATNAIAKDIFKDLTYDPVEDFAPISLVARVPRGPDRKARTSGKLGSRANCP